MQRQKIIQYKQKKQRVKMEFSKIIYILNLSFVAIVTGLSFLCVIMSGQWGITDLSPITAIVSASFLELATHSVVYASKAKAENVLKISKQIQEEKIDTQNIETANQIVNGNM